MSTQSSEDGCGACSSVASHHSHAPADEHLDEQSTGNPDGVTAPEIPDPPIPAWMLGTNVATYWGGGWRAGYEDCLLDQGRTGASS